MWPPEIPKEERCTAPDVTPPELIYDRPPSVGQLKLFAQDAFRYFCARVSFEIGKVNKALYKYHRQEGTLEEYQRQANAFRRFVERPENLGFYPKFWVQNLKITPQLHGDYALGFTIEGAVRFPGNSGPDGESSSSSSSLPVLPKTWP